MTPANPTLSARGTLPPLTEAEWQEQITDLAADLGWQWVHFRAGLTRSGRWAVAVQGPLGRGWPDLVLVHPRKHRVLFVELKRDSTKPEPAQDDVLATLRAAGAEVYVWRPSDFLAAQEVLER